MKSTSFMLNSKLVDFIAGAFGFVVVLYTSIAVKSHNEAKSVSSEYTFVDVKIVGYPKPNHIIDCKAITGNFQYLVKERQNSYGYKPEGITAPIFILLVSTTLFSLMLINKSAIIQNNTLLWHIGMHTELHIESFRANKLTVPNDIKPIDNNVGNRQRFLSIAALLYIPFWHAIKPQNECKHINKSLTIYLKVEAF
uniref:Uncharacterized protein n=1 Tax=Glossina palpalis gambiensis TaxID=67801 RepID=A0A1B0ASZ3_9MUSC